jgi:hypothetical protein
MTKTFYEHEADIYYGMLTPEDRIEQLEYLIESGVLSFDDVKDELEANRQILASRKKQKKT